MRRLYVWVSVLLLLCFGLGGCNKVETEKPTAENENTNISLNSNKETPGATMLPENKKVVVWTIPDEVTTGELKRNVELINEKLEQDGYDFLLQIQTLSAKNYRNLLFPVLKEGKTDIASLGMDYEGGSMGYAQSLIRDGYFEELSEYLSSEQGSKLQKAYCEEEWKIVETDGGIYSLPNQYGMKGRAYMAFNRAYVSEEMLENFSGSVEEIEGILEQIDILEGVIPILGSVPFSSLAVMSGKQEVCGTFVDLQTGAVENPYRNEVFCRDLRKLNELYKKGYIDELEDEEELVETDVVRDGNYVLWFGGSYGDFYEEVKEQMITVPLPFVLPNALSCTTGISKTAANKEAALELLTLIYTEKEYQDLLLYGKEEETYQLVNGYVCSIYGEDFRVQRRNLMFGIYDYAWPCRGDDLANNRREMKTEMYQSEYCRDSVILGMKLDYSSFSKDMYGVGRVVEKSYSLWKAEDFEGALQDAINAFEEAGGNKVIAELNRQIGEWLQESN